MSRNNLLIISNNSLSETDNNGKTILSIIRKYPTYNVAQLYFHNNLPTVKGFKYFQLSDIDIIKGQFIPQKRGREINPKIHFNDSVFSNHVNKKLKSKGIKRNVFSLSIREIFWKNKWKSAQLEEWLDEIAPDIVFFCMGDCLFPYDICLYIMERYKPKLLTYVTDDYILPRSYENLIERYYRKKVKKRMGECVKQSYQFFTISERMRGEYASIFGVDSRILYNLSDSLRDDVLCEQSGHNKKIVFLYAGSLYYGRGEVLLQIANIFENYNKESSEKKVIFKIYSNEIPSHKFRKKLEKIESVYFGGKLNQDDLRRELNLSNVLVFVESLEEKQIEKVRLSFSTKIPEYISLGKPIIAVGGKNTGSMDCLKKVASCVYSKKDLKDTIVSLLNSKECWGEMGKSSLHLYAKMKKNINCDMDILHLENKGEEK